MRKELSNEILLRFFAGEASEAETDRIAAWLDENPVEHQKTLDRAHELYIIGIMTGTAADAAESRDESRENLRSLKRRRMVRWVAASVAALAVCFGANYLFFAKRVDEMARSTTTIEAPAGQRIRFTLGDGSVVDLNSGGRLTYPSLFTRGERRVSLSGEAMFDVSPDAKNPFVVQTFSYEVKVLGTRFNVIADAAKNEFSTALLEGRVAVSSLSSDEKVVLLPDMTARLSEGRLVTEKIGSMDEYLWPEGIVSVGGLPYERLVEKLESAYGVRIVLARETPPVIKYAKLKIRISDGIGHAMSILSLASDFTYEYDTSENTVTIK